MEILVLLAVGILVLLGNLAGYIIRMWRLRKLRKSNIQKPLYNIEADLSPAEFGLIVDGTVGYKELVAEVIALSIQGQVTLVKQPAGNFKVSRNSATFKHATPIQAAILTALGQQNLGLFSLVPTIKYETERSLISKGWIVSKKPPLRGISDVPATYTYIALMAGAAGLIVAAVAAIAIGVSSSDLFLIMALALSTEMILAACVAAVVVFRGEMIHNAQFIMAATAKYTNQWKDVYGVYEYIRVSGMDIFTPDYQTMDFTGLDPLYPYAVAAGLDKKIVRLVL